MNVSELGSCTLTELALSADNVMVWALIMSRLNVPARQQRKVLAAGIGVAVVMRIAAILAGAAALERFAWLTYVLGAVLVITGVKILRTDSEASESRVARLMARWVKSPAVLAAVSLGVTDIVFAVDSIPASFGITRDSTAIIVANGIALAALWVLYNLVSRLMDRLKYLHVGLAAVLVWLGIAMLGHDVVQVPTLVELGVIVGLLGLSGVASLVPVKRLT